jgi:uncharacterized protein YecE (DUF72 family)
MNFYVGTSGYGYKEWRGIFYPERISAGEMLRFYSGRLNAVEINNTFYRMPTQRLLLSWEKQVPASFVFALKAPQVITHLKRLKGVEEETGYLFNALNALESKLGPVLFQFPKSFRADRPTLQAFLNLIPAGVSCAFEFRSTSWLDAEVLDVLHKKGCSFCTADTDENPAREIISTASWGYLRLRRSHYSDTDLSQWIERVLSQKWKKVFVFFKHEEEAKGAELAMRFKELASA